MSASPLIESLKAAMPYIRLYRGQTFVIKLGGALVARPRALENFATQAALLEHLSIRVVVVHGGGPQATRMQEKLGIEPRVIAGRRVTDLETLEVTKMVFSGQINNDILAAFRKKGVSAVGISGLDGALIQTTRRPPIEVRDENGETREVDFGHVGDVKAEQIDPKLIEVLCEADFVPVLASLAADKDGNILNVNADTLACELAVALKAKKLVFLTEVPGILRDADDPASLVPFADPEDLNALVEQNAISGGMLPKVRACVRAATGGVKRTHIVDGLKENSLLTEVFTAEGCGTMIVGKREKQSYQEKG